MSLFLQGVFALHGGSMSSFKIDCDGMSDDDIAAAARALSQRLPAFGDTIGVPRGGRRLAEAMREYATTGPLLICDDVLTTGGSMEAMRRNEPSTTLGCVLFARGACPRWITPLFTMTPEN